MRSCFELVTGVLPDGSGPSTAIPSVYMLEENGSLYMIDSGAGEGMRRKVARRLSHHARHCDSLVLLNTHGHVDHIGNNGVIMEVPFGSREHYIHGKGLVYFSPYKHYGRAMEEIMGFHNIFNNPDMPRRLLFIPVRVASRFAPRAAFTWLAGRMLSWYGRVDPSPVPVTTLGRTEHISVGSKRLRGYRLGPLKLIHVGGHSPDSLLVFHEKSGDLLVGDITFGLYPLWPDSDSGEVERAFRLVHDLMVEGVVTRVMASHRPVPITDLTGLDAYLREAGSIHRLIDSVIREEVRAGADTVHGAYMRITASDDPAAVSALRMQYPRTPFFLKNIIAFRVREDERYEFVGVDRFRRCR